ncbi:Glyoxalase/bleomycin resistance protein/dioxygenase [Paenibacillus mucilaginosus 3016]|uniref:Glyoxalase/bleomycin resistance protein/dioxygenase n=1 Tax=Paenibacillus mucilaginosus 3016 TaxID=1116391 RepID=H6NN13_9BACL|nr:VOC family protein [Paenibacillus mucilaginosus]AFC31053.1 Glyoxalase/bleomycin resistance protein/dioxygenase [Paenibacillus mucilaginosus 3016]WFA19639.1 VOC family protein [Paenibacillus mucilaginosus]
MLGLKHIDVITVFVEELERTKSFYCEVFGIPVVYEDSHSAVFNFGNMSINLLAASEARELIDPAAVAVREAGTRFQLTIRVEDVDAVCSDLYERGVALLNGPMNRPWGVRTASFVDPGGHIWEVAQELTQ